MSLSSLTLMVMSNSLSKKCKVVWRAELLGTDGNPYWKGSRAPPEGPLLAVINTVRNGRSSPGCDLQRWWVLGESQPDCTTCSSAPLMWHLQSPKRLHHEQMFPNSYLGVERKLSQNLIKMFSGY